MEITSSSQIENMIYVIRGQRVMLDADLAKLYEIPTGRLNEQVKRNIDRFPNDFMYQLSETEFEGIQNSMAIKSGRGGRRKLPLVFTECGIAMLSSVLTSSRAISVNISIMRTFVRLRSFLAMETTLTEKVGKLEKSTNQLFKIVFERLDHLEESVPSHSKERRRIGISPKHD